MTGYKGRLYRRKCWYSLGLVGYIVKQTFQGGRLHTKGYAHHETEVTWVVLAHHLWVLARLPI